MLDDLKFIHEKDAQDALGITEKSWQQLVHDFEVPKLDRDIWNVIYAGMGGSALAAAVSVSWPGYPIPFEICRDYVIPSYVGDKTLFIASSYSGNTEETIIAMDEAATRNAQIVVVASGGEMMAIAKERGYPFVQLPTGFQPRHAAFYALAALVQILQKAGLVETKETRDELREASEFLEKAVEDWRADEPTEHNPAKKLALEVVGTSPVIYAGVKLFPAAYKWKISFNENAKNVAWCGEFSEFHHNEFLGWSSHPVEKPYSIIELRSKFEHERIGKRFEITNRMLSGRWPNPHVIEVEGKTLLQQLLWAITLGDFVSVYTALLNGINPTPVELIEKFKKELRG